MANLKTLKTRIKSVRSTQKITKAMKVVAAAKLRRAKDHMEDGRYYYDAILAGFDTLLSATSTASSPSRFLTEPATLSRQLMVVFSSDRGLCGPFNTNIFKAVKQQLALAAEENRQLYLICVGAKTYEALRNHYPDRILKSLPAPGKHKLSYAEAQKIMECIHACDAQYHFDQCTLLYNHFVSAIQQKVVCKTLFPCTTAYREALRDPASENGASHHLETTKTSEHTLTARHSIAPEPLFEPDMHAVQDHLIQHFMTASVYHAQLHHTVSEHGARMTAMDNATRSADKMVKNLTLLYNRTRQAAITKELIEIISGAEAV